MAGEASDHARVLRARAAVEAVYRCGEDLLGRAVPLAPIEEGTLRGSAALAMIVNGVRYEGEGALRQAMVAAEALARAGQSITVNAEVSFNTVYAARQHEETEWRHPLGGQAKYLEQPMREQAGRYVGIVELAIRTAT